MDAVGSAIRVDTRGNEVLRVLPRLNEAVNEEWISDKARFACDGLKRQRLDRPYVRGEDGKLSPVSWEQAFAAIRQNLDGLQGEEIAAIAGDQADVESLYALKGLMAELGSPHTDCRQDGAKLDDGTRASYLFNSAIEGIDQADALLIIGSNPRWEAPVLNARIRKRWLTGELKVGVIGETLRLTYDYEYLGAGPETLGDVAAGKHAFADVLKKAERPMLILGSGAVARVDGAQILALAQKLADKTGMVKDGWNGFNLLHRAAGRVGALDVGFLPGQDGRDVAGILEGAESGAVKAVWLLGADEIEASRLRNAFVIYQGHHGDAGAQVADVILPGAAYTEKSALYVNTEGRPQMTRRAAFPPGEAREDWAIIRAVSEQLGRTLPYNSLLDLRAELWKKHPHLAQLDDVRAEPWEGFGKKGEVKDAPFQSPIDTYYMTCPISRVSETMAQCVQEIMNAGTDDGKVAAE